MKNSNPVDINFEFLFQSVPGLYLVLTPDLKICAVSDAYLNATMTKREAITGLGLFEVFPDNPSDPKADGVSNLRSSLQNVIQFKRPHQMDIQKYDIRKPDGNFEIRYWSPVNKPVLSDKNELLYIIHSVEDVTDQHFSDKKNKTTELLLQSSIESLKDTLIFSVDLNYRYLNFNTAHKKATFIAYGLEIEVGMSLLGHITNDTDRIKAKNNFDLAFTGISHATIEEYGEIEHFYFETRYSPVVNEVGEIVGATAFSHNISDRKKAEDQLIDTNKFLDTILENVPNMLFVKDAKELKFLRLNSAGEKLLGISSEELVGKNDYDFFPVEQADFFTKNDREVLLKRELLHIAEEVITTYEGEKWLRTKKIPVNDPFGQPLYLIGISEDITEERSVEAKIREINKQLETANKDLERSAELFSKLFDLNPGAISISKLSDLTLYDVNESFLELFGFETKEEVIGKTAEELNILPEPSLREQIMKKVRLDGRVDNLEGRMRTKTGLDKWVSASVHVVEINDAPFLLTVTFDITRRKEQEDLVKKQSEKLRKVNEELLSSNELFSKLFDLNPASIAISRLQDATLLSVNQAFLDMFEFEHRNDVLDRTAEQIQILVTSSQRPMIVEELLKNKRIVNIEDRYQTRNKAIRWASNSVQLIDIAGTQCLLSVMIDITKRKEQEHLLEKQSEELSMVNHELESFSYSVSHDLKAPLRSLQGFSRALLENYAGKFDDDADRWLKFIESNAKRMDNLIHDILSFSKVSRADINVSVINMQQKVLDIMNTEKLLYPGKNVNFEVNDLPKCKGDITMLRQVWQNLISNAFKYSSKNDDIKICVKSWIEDSFQVYSIRDNGVGFDDKYKDKLFGVFQRLHSNDEFDGTGVGLAIVSRIIQKHGGWIEANSDLGQGSEFKFGLPIT
jgi:PAS domain S-box-containing protein